MISVILNDPKKDYNSLIYKLFFHSLEWLIFHVSKLALDIKIDLLLYLMKWFSHGYYESTSYNPECETCVIVWKIV